MIVVTVLGDRLREARLNMGFTLEEAGEQIGVRLNTVWRYEKGEIRPSEPVLKLCCRIYEKQLSWFFGEDEEPAPVERDWGSQANQSSLTPESPGGSALTDLASNAGMEDLAQYLSARFDRLESAIRWMADEDDALALSDIRPVKVVEVAAAAGGGAEIYDETVVGRLWFRRDWLERHAIDPTQCHVISVRGESMEPTLPNGCSILVDRSQGRRQRRDGNIFVMRTEDGLVVKRVSREEDGRWVIESDNPAWEAAPWSEDTEIIGEVRWAARTF